jgi:putative NADPH-quinone reductase
VNRKVLLIDGHPDQREERFIHVLARHYASGAQQAGHAVRILRVASMQFPLLAQAEDFRDGQAPAPIREAQQALLWADHIVILYPLWLGSMPALLKGFFEQLLRPGFAFGQGAGKRLPRKLLKGKSARIVVTMGMPAAYYSLVYRAHSLRSLKRNILAFCGIGPVRSSLIGMVEGSANARRVAWLRRMELLGAQAR